MIRGRELTSAHYKHLRLQSSFARWSSSDASIFAFQTYLIFSCEVFWRRSPFHVIYLLIKIVEGIFWKVAFSFMAAARECTIFIKPHVNRFSEFLVQKVLSLLSFQLKKSPPYVIAVVIRVVLGHLTHFCSVIKNGLFG